MAASAAIFFYSLCNFPALLFVLYTESETEKRDFSHSKQKSDHSNINMNQKKHLKLLKIMKTLFKTFAVLAISTSFAFANVTPSSFKVGMYNVQNTHKLKVFVEKGTKDALLLEVKDSKGNVLQSEKLGKGKSQMAVSLDLANLESGDYTLYISDKNSTYTKDIRLEKEQKEELKIVI
jgi:hypothetical protein